MNPKIYKDSAVPRYLQIKRYLKAEILADRVEGKLPSERALADQCGVSYLTVRRAVGELVEEGLLYRERGRGTFVCEVGRINRKTYSIGFLRRSQYGLANPYYGWVFTGLERACRVHHYTLFYATRPDDLLPLSKTRTDRELVRKVDGIVATSMHQPDEKALVLKMSRFVPVVTLNEVIEGEDIPAVIVDNVNGAKDAVNYLIGLGHRRIGHVTGPLDWMDGEQRCEGYRKALLDAGLNVDEDLIVEGDFVFETGCKAAEKLLSLPDRPTAIFAANDAMAAGVLKKIHQRDLKIPGDISVIGFDDVISAAEYYPALTTMRVAKLDIGDIAFHVLQEMIETGKSTLPIARKVVRPTLVERESCRAIEPCERK